MPWEPLGCEKLVKTFLYIAEVESILKILPNADKLNCSITVLVFVISYNVWSKKVPTVFLPHHSFYHVQLNVLYEEKTPNPPMALYSGNLVVPRIRK